MKTRIPSLIRACALACAALWASASAALAQALPARGAADAMDAGSRNTDLLRIILIVIVVFLVYKFLRGRAAARSRTQDGQGLDPADTTRADSFGASAPEERNASAPRPADPVSRPGSPARDQGQPPASGPVNPGPSVPPRQRLAEMAWARMQGKTANNGAATTLDAQAAPGSVSGAVPHGSPEEEFLHGAKLLYSRVYESLDARDLEDVRPFATEKAYAQLKTRLEALPASAKTDLILVKAKLLTPVNGTEAEVEFNTLMRRTPGPDASTEVREVWRFTRENTDATWKVDSIDEK